MLAALKRPRDSPEQSADVAMCSRFVESPASKRTRARVEPLACDLFRSSAFGGILDGAGACPTDGCGAPVAGQRIDPHTGEMLFTLEQTRDIVRRALEEKERRLREQYDRILQQKLQEQYQAFAKFNEDYISRSLKADDLGYVS